MSDEQNRETFGPAANPNGHGHNYVVEVTLAGEPHPVTGMVIDLKELKEILEDEIVTPMDHRFLNYEVKPFDKVVPTVENVAREIWRRLERRLSTSSSNLQNIRVFETPDLYVDVSAGDFAAS